MSITWFSHKNPLPAAEQELKFRVPKSAAPALTRWLDRVFRPHQEHAVSTICSIYFDTANRVSFDEKQASDYRKTKYRIRWYADEAGVPVQLPAFIEIKEKHGAVRRKYRSVLPMPAAELAATPLTDASWSGIFRRDTTGKLPMPEMELRPVLELRYRRQRYVHPVFTETFCLDSDIRCQRTHPSSLPPAQGAVLDHDVFEQKGRASHPLPVLQALPRFGVRRDAISKYFLMILQLQPE